MLTLILVGLLLGVDRSNGHGRLMQPPARNSMWRFGFVNPVNYNDNEVFCGGVDRQFNNNNGDCGVCGDSYDDQHPQLHETGGKYGNGIVSKTYVMGSVIDIEIEITANHKGSFMLKLCPVRTRNGEATQDCLDRNILTQEDGDKRFPIYERPHSVKLTRKARLPAGLTCSRCVLQWTWRSANSWGVCTNGTGGLGCGPQETFRNCADVRIVRTERELPATDNPRAIMVKDDNSKTGFSPLIVRSQVCVAKEAWSQFQGMSDWCQLNCLRYPPHCPETMCTCLTSCRALPNQENITDFKCSKRCLRYPHRDQCPKQCKCSSDPAEDNDSIDAVIIDARGHAQVRAQKPNPSMQTFYKLYNPLYPVQWTFTPTLITNYLYKK